LDSRPFIISKNHPKITFVIPPLDIETRLVFFD